MFEDRISDDWLIFLYREGNQLAIDFLFDRYSVFLYGFINKMMRCNYIYIDYKELFQEMILVFINCINRYDEEAGCFYYFVRKAVERKLIDCISKINKLKCVAPLDEMCFNEEIGVIDFVQEDSNLEYYETELYNMISKRLSDEDLKIVDMKVEGYSYQEISRILGMSKQGIYRKVNIIKNVIKDIIEKID